MLQKIKSIYWKWRWNVATMKRCKHRIKDVCTFDTKCVMSCDPMACPKVKKDDSKRYKLTEEGKNYIDQKMIEWQAVDPHGYAEATAIIDRTVDEFYENERQVAAKRILQKSSELFSEDQRIYMQRKEDQRNEHTQWKHEHV